MKFGEYKKKMFLDGQKVEERFAKLFKNPTFSSPEEDMFDHWDVKIPYKGELLKVDVKGIKKINRKDSETNEFFHYIELRNVKGKEGWLYGKADLFAFETEDYWVIVRKGKLQDFIALNVSKIRVENAKDSLYKFYQRKGWKDLITMVKTLDLMYLADSIILKSKDHEEHVS
jgi:hypothetical protein